MDRIKKNAIFLIDGSSFLYRAYYGLRPLSTSKGVPVQATYGFCRAIKKIIDDFNPTRMILVWDSKGPTFRTEVYEAYKATREAPPSDLNIQRDHIKKFADLIGLHQLAKSGYEADDLLAAVVAERPSDQVVLITPDKDLHQLISDHVLVFDPFKKEIIDEGAFKEKHGFEPRSLLMYHALLGDASDNIPGVRGVGEKTAQLLTQEFHTLKNLYDHLDQVTNMRARRALEEHKKEAFLSEQLFELQAVPLQLADKDLAFDKARIPQARPLFEELEFTSFLNQLGAAPAQPVQQSILSAANWVCEIVQDTAALKNLCALLRQKKFFAYDNETTGLDPLRDALVGISFAVDTHTGYYVPCGHVNEEGASQLDREAVLAALKPIFEDATIGKTVHNAKFDQLSLWQYGVEVRGVVFDSVIAAHLLRQGPQKIGLKALSQQYLGEPMQPFATVLGKKRAHFGHVPIADAALYSAHDALQTFKLYQVLIKDLDKEPKLKKLFYDVEMPLNFVLLRMEQRGIQLEVGVLHAVGVQVNHDLVVLEGKIFAAIKAAGIDGKEGMNLNSPRQMETLLFDELGLPSMKLSREGRRSTDQEVLAELAKEHPIPGLVLQYRELYKLKSTYIEPLALQVNPKTGRVHTTYGQIDIVTGRISSSDPNLQNIPAGSKYGMQIREAFVAPRGRRFLSADYSQIDLRVLAHLSGDANLKRAFLEDRDIHRQTAAEIFGVALDAVTPQQRAVGKRINFSIIYGLTPYGLSRDLDIKPSVAKEYIDKYFAQYPGVEKWMDKVVEDAIKTGYVETYLGRRRYVPGLLEQNRVLYEAARRVAINTPVQGTSADIIKLAMLRLDEAFASKHLDASMLLQIHDELIIEFPAGEEGALEAVVHECMEQVVDWSVPLTVATRTGKNWAEVTK